MRQNNHQAGFTLLEILLVIVMIAVTSAMVVPSIQISGMTVEDESSRLRIVMRFAMEESQLSGIPLRWVATKQGWHFEVLEQGVEENMWLPYENPPIETYNLSSGIVILAVEHAGDFKLGMEVKLDNQEKDVEPVVGSILLLPDGTTSQSNIILADEFDATIRATLEVRPGPGGIRMKKELEY